MIEFIDGPAKGLKLEIRRTPILLRLVHSKDGWDALDQLDDKPEHDETIYVYEVIGNVGAAFVDYTDKTGKRRGKQIRCGNYRLYPDEQPPDAMMRTKEAWDRWCASVEATVRARREADKQN